MRTLVIFTFAILAILATGCLSDIVAPGGVVGSWSYTSYDTLGAELVTGWLEVKQQDSTAVTGEWHFTNTSGRQDIGPQVGDGKLIGTVRGDTVWIELNPQYRDNNLELRGLIKGNEMSGRWVWISIIGPTNHGPFTAVK